jgi:hypothetical protein
MFIYILPQGKRSVVSMDNMPDDKSNLLNTVSMPLSQGQTTSHSYKLAVL